MGLVAVEGPVAFLVDDELELAHLAHGDVGRQLGPACRARHRAAVGAGHGELMAVDVDLRARVGRQLEDADQHAVVAKLLLVGDAPGQRHQLVAVVAGNVERAAVQAVGLPHLGAGAEGRVRRLVGGLACQRLGARQRVGAEQRQLQRHLPAALRRLLVGRIAHRAQLHHGDEARCLRQLGLACSLLQRRACGQHVQPLRQGQRFGVRRFTRRGGQGGQVLVTEMGLDQPVDVGAAGQGKREQQRQRRVEGDRGIRQAYRGRTKASRRSARTAGQRGERLRAAEAGRASAARRWAQASAGAAAVVDVVPVVSTGGGAAVRQQGARSLHGLAAAPCASPCPL